MFGGKLLMLIIFLSSYFFVGSLSYNFQPIFFLGSNQKIRKTNTQWILTVYYEKKEIPRSMISRKSLFEQHATELLNNTSVPKKISNENENFFKRQREERLFLRKRDKREERL